MLIEAGIGGGITFVFEHFSDHGRQMAVVLRSYPGQMDVRQVIVIDIGVDIVGNTVTVPDRGGYAVNIAGILVIGEQENCGRRNVPIEVGVVDVVLNQGVVIAADFGQSGDPGDNALLTAPGFDRIRPGQEHGVIGNDDDVFHVVFIGLANAV